MITFRKIAYYLVILCLIWFPMQDTILSFLYRIYPGNYLFVFLILKEIMIISAFFLLLINFVMSNKLVISKIEIFSFLYLLLCLFYFLFVEVEGISKIAAFTTLRTLLLPILLVIVGKWLMLNLKEIRIFTKVIITMGILSVLFGFIEILTPVEKFWLGIMDLYGFLTNVKGMPLHHFVKSVPGNFWGFVGERRMAGLHGSPLALGYYVVVPILITFSLMISNYKINKFSCVILMIGIFLTETRMAIIAVVLGIFLILKEQVLNFILNSKIHKIAFLMLSFLIFGGITLIVLSDQVRSFLYKTITIQEGRAIGHLNALMQSVSVVDEFIIKGAGIGTAGAWASIHGSRVKGMASENVYIPIMVQIGGIGLFLFFLWWYNCYKKLSLKYKQEKNLYLKGLIKAILAANVVYFISGFVSEQILTFTSVAHFWLLLGILVGYRNL